MKNAPTIKFQREDIQIGSPEWIELRRAYIGASDAPVVMGVSPWRTPLQLWMEKTGMGDSQPVTKAMHRGTVLEPEALAMYCDLVGINMLPRIMFSQSNEFQMATLDGIDASASIAVEIKTPGAVDHRVA